MSDTNIHPYTFEVGIFLCPAFRNLCEEFKHFNPREFVFREGGGLISRKFYVYASEEVIGRFNKIIREWLGDK